jgi:hypothetical protein
MDLENFGHVQGWPAVTGEAVKTCRIEVKLFHKKSLVRLASMRSRTLKRAFQKLTNSNFKMQWRQIQITELILLFPRVRVSVHTSMNIHLSTCSFV